MTTLMGTGGNEGPIDGAGGDAGTNPNCGKGLATVSDLAGVAALLEAGAPPDPPMTGPSPLARALRRADLDCVRLLLAAGASPNASGSGSEHPLIEAARAGALACVEALIDAADSAMFGGKRHGGDRFAIIPTVEMFNTFNNDNLVNPLTTVALFNFDGFLRQGVGDPRQLQLSVKFTF